MSVGKRASLFAALILYAGVSAAEEPLPDWFARSAIPPEWRYTVTLEPVLGISTYRLTPEVAFEDANPLIRYRDARSLSLYTFANFRRSRLFFGVNEKGLLGLHFRGDQSVDVRDILAGL